MTELRNAEREIHSFRSRLLIASGFVLLCFAVLAGRFLLLQVVRHEDFHAQAEENRISIVPITPNRGLITDRNGIVLARNYAAFTLEVTPARVEHLDQTIEALSHIIEITPRDHRRFKKLLEESKSLESLPIRIRLTDEEVARFTVQRFRFPGVEIKARLFRQYPLGQTASHLIGYIGRISNKDQEDIDNTEDAENYRGTDYIGKVGLEESYEKELHGVTGFEKVEVSAGGRPVRTLSRTPPQPGNNLALSVDIKLQQIAEQAFGNRRGALVAVEPATGEVLAFVSMPTFDPNLFVDGIDSENWKLLNESPDKPLLNRPLRGTYPPGSTYKPFMALAALTTGKRAVNGTPIHDPGYFMFGNHKFRDSKPEGNGTVDLFKSIVVSSDTYYYMVANDLGVDAIHDFMRTWGFGETTGIDLRNEGTGTLPSSDWKLKRFKQKWIPGETISLGIGQGYNAFTPLQMAHAVATLANNGIEIKPHLVRDIEDARNNQHNAIAYDKSAPLPVKPEYIDFIKQAMVAVNKEGTAARVFTGAKYDVAGKTGTAQVVGIKQNEKYDEKKVAERHRDHSWFIAFAPAEAPKIAIAVIVENGGFGAQAAAPIVRQLLDYYLQGQVPNAPAAELKETEED
ncbi:MAG: penicillin-binding protein 2 [Burkholderiaceae bacterium]|nr:MAG: penicillin-binding protein 2 [Burkholderiaceae bacterium]